MTNDESEPRAGMPYELEIARKRIAELEAARAKASEGAGRYFAESERSMREEAAALAASSPGFGGRCSDVLAELDRRATVIASQAAELERLRALVRDIKALAPDGTRGLAAIALDVFTVLDKFDSEEAKR